jgi:hypothetical protein
MHCKWVKSIVYLNSAVRKSHWCLLYLESPNLELEMFTFAPEQPPSPSLLLTLCGDLIKPDREDGQANPY